MYACYQYTLDLLTVAASLRLALLTRVAAVDIIVIGMAVQAIVGEAPDSCEWLRNVATRGHQGQRKGECSSRSLFTGQREDTRIRRWGADIVGYTTKIW